MILPASLHHYRAGKQGTHSISAGSSAPAGGSTSVTPAGQTCILIADDHDPVREGLAIFVRAFPDFVLVGEAASGAEAVDLCIQHRPDVVLLDLVMPVMDGVAAIRAIRRVYPRAAILVLVGSGQQALVEDALQAGAVGYVDTTVRAAGLSRLIREVHTRQAAESPRPQSGIDGLA